MSITSGTNSGVSTHRPKKETSGMRYARIYRLEADGSTTPNYRNKIPVGRAFYNGENQHWIKFDDDWHGPGEFGHLEINKAEFETDDAFELFPTLKVAYRPVRMWFKIHGRAMHLIMLVMAFLTLNVAMNVPNLVPVDYNLFAIIPLGLICLFSVIWQIGKWEKWKWWTKIFDMPVSFE